MVAMAWFYLLISKGTKKNLIHPFQPPPKAPKQTTPPSQKNQQEQKKKNTDIMRKTKDFPPDPSCIHMPIELV